MREVTVTISGAPGSGKTMLALRIEEFLNGEHCDLDVEVVDDDRPEALARKRALDIDTKHDLLPDVITIRSVTTRSI